MVRIQVLFFQLTIDDYAVRDSTDNPLLSIL